eukprot:c18946_g1_i1.p1 GENE.c18946_g1_i1~~c18946_g1_i1.p1  ORF type:complete len:291 (-),score=88.20 c18946_g1_i1:66-938(-)
MEMETNNENKNDHDNQHHTNPKLTAHIIEVFDTDDGLLGDSDIHELHPSHELWYSNGTRKKSKFRGVLHEIFFYLTPFFAIPMFWYCETYLAYIAATCHVISTAFCYGASSQFHRRKWTLNQEIIFAKLDYMGIFVFICFQYTPVALILVPDVGIPIMIAEAIFVIGGMILVFNTPPNPCCCSINASRYLYSAVFLSMGLVALLGVPEFHRHASVLEITCTWVMAFIQCLGASIYTWRLFDYFSDTFGFHEVFHLCVCAGGLLSYVVNLSVLIRIHQKKNVYAYYISHVI